MASFSASDAALTGFRIVREHPRTLLIWIAIQLVVQFVLGAGMVQMAGPALTSLANSGSGASADPAQAMAMLRQVGPLYGLLFLFSIVFYPIHYSTMARAVLRPQDEGFGYIRLGADELRQIGLFLLVIGVGIVAYIALIIAIVVVFIPVGLMTGGGRGGASGTLVAGLLAVIVVLAVIGLWIYVWVRLSLASPLTFASRRIDLFGSWRLTRGIFWPMLGAYVVATILAIIVTLLTLAISAAVGAAVGGGFGGLQSVFRPDMSSLAVYLTPARIVAMVVNAISTALVWPVLLTPAAAIYRTLPEAVDADKTAAAFD